MNYTQNGQRKATIKLLNKSNGQELMIPERLLSDKCHFWSAFCQKNIVAANPARLVEIAHGK